MTLEFGPRHGTHFAYTGKIMVGVFLSHSSKDKPFVRDLADALEADGEIKVWLDECEQFDKPRPRDGYG